jgi:antirestriction protein ArdC
MNRAKTSTPFRKPLKSRPDLYQEVTDRVIASLAAGTAPWRQPWHGYGRARNLVSGTVYTGINAFLLNFLAPKPIPLYLTFKQARERGGHVRKGARAERVYFFKTLHKDAEGQTVAPERAEQLADGGQEVQRIPFLRSFAVFNVADVEGITWEVPELSTIAQEPVDACEELLIGAAGRLPAILHEVEREAYYEPRRDTVNLPAMGSFRTGGDYYATLFHELSHSTGHVTRLNRPGVAGQIDPQGDEYAREELIAEMGAAFLCALTGLDAPALADNSAAYLAAWIDRLRADNKLIFRAAAAAQRSTDYLLGVTP